MHFELLCIMHFKVTRKLFISNHIIIRYIAAVKIEQKVHEYKRFDKRFLFCTNKYIKYKFAKSDCSEQCSKIGKKVQLIDIFGGF